MDDWQALHNLIVAAKDGDSDAQNQIAYIKECAYAGDPQCGYYLSCMHKIFHALKRKREKAARAAHRAATAIQSDPDSIAPTSDSDTRSADQIVNDFVSWFTDQSDAGHVTPEDVANANTGDTVSSGYYIGAGLIDDIVNPIGSAISSLLGGSQPQPTPQYQPQYNPGLNNQISTLTQQNQAGAQQLNAANAYIAQLQAQMQQQAQQQALQQGNQSSTQQMMEMIMANKQAQQQAAQQAAAQQAAMMPAIMQMRAQEDAARQQAQMQEQQMMMQEQQMAAQQQAAQQQMLLNPQLLSVLANSGVDPSTVVLSALGFAAPDSSSSPYGSSWGGHVPGDS